METLFEQFLDKQLETSKGDSFKVTCNNDEITYTDCYGDSLTWDNNEINKASIVAMIQAIK